ncbi:protein Smaug homolog 1 [Tribolium madens]|uniref:protein Smaug homolog 1 n=1 Tax=Tribolium madens TaxID=41895 RepID=UPI001CF75873|nr:protein Smaug homolog 1 [Tribolium madens]XP_044254976.1 protein Smaug homolog 1 [Tribolium madens]XP_044254977.1 protein Smaug homolog 1 [Tribolium madens]XP_044254978.1 protein Smaug homolog 1 [Tribolium madens]
MESSPPQMRDFSEFCEQLHEIRLKFHKWDSCERTVALYYLMTGLPFANARFLQHALEQCIASASTPEAQALERNANNSVFVARLLMEHPQNALGLLLTHLPLLKPGNKEAANSYLVTIRRLLAEFIAPPCKIYNECVEIMSYVFIHPAFDKEDKRGFKHLLKQVLNRVSPENFIHESSDESSSPENTDLGRGGRRSNSLTTQTSSHESLREVWSSQENLSQPPPKPRSYSLSNDKTLVNLTTLQSSSSETRLQDLQILSNLPVMKSILSWLKSLRLHKYSWVFHNLTYQQMLDLSDDTLQAIGITKGARHKLLLSIAKLKERSTMLTELETEVMNGGDLNLALKKLKSVLQTPLQVTSGEDLPSQFVKVMGKVCTQLLMLRQPSDECLMLFVNLCERSDGLEAFSDDQKRRLNMWKGQLTKGNHVPVYTQKMQGNNSRSGWQCKMPLATFTQETHTQKSSSYPNVKNSTTTTTTINPHRHSVGSVTFRKDLYPVVKSVEMFKNHHPSSEKNSNNNNNNSQFHVRFEDSESDRNKKIKNTDIENSLESLCLQMMEHALGP